MKKRRRINGAWSHSFRIDISRLTAATWKEEPALVSLESLIEGWCSG